MKKAVSLAVCAVVILLGFALFAENHMQIKNSSSQQSTIDEQSNFTSNAASSQESEGLPAMTSRTETYVVKIYQGKIGVFMDEEDIPFHVIDVEVSSLPKADQILLTNGIYVSDSSQLNGILEDYES